MKAKLILSALLLSVFGLSASAQVSEQVKYKDGYYLVGSMTVPYDEGFVPNPSYEFQPTASAADTYTLSVGSMSSSDKFYVMQVSDGVARAFSGTNGDNMIPTNSTDGNKGSEIELISGNQSNMTLNNNYVNVIFTLTLDNGTPKTLSYEGTVDGSSWVISPGNDQTMQSGTVTGNTIFLETLNEAVLAYIYAPKTYENTNVWYTVSVSSTDPDKPAATAELPVKKAAINNGYFTVSLAKNTTGEINIYNNENATGDPLATFTYTVKNGVPTAVEGIEAVEGEARYFNLQGVEVKNPDRGIFIKVQNGKASKVIM